MLTQEVVNFYSMKGGHYVPGAILAFNAKVIPVILYGIAKQSKVCRLHSTLRCLKHSLGSLQFKLCRLHIAPPESWELNLLTSEDGRLSQPRASHLNPVSRVFDCKYYSLTTEP